MTEFKILTAITIIITLPTIDINIAISGFVCLTNICAKTVTKAIARIFNNSLIIKQKYFVLLQINL